MMNCKDLHIHIDDYRSGELSTELTTACEAHLGACAECARAMDEHNNLLESLKAMPVVGPSEGFAERALCMAVEQNVGQRHHHRRGFMVGFGSAAVAALALWVVGINPQMISDSTAIPEMAKVDTTANVGTGIPEFSITLNEQRDIKLAFYSPEDLKGAKIILQLPENVALVGHEGRRQLVWKTNLAKGDNTLRLPIIATRAVTSAATSEPLSTASRTAATEPG